MFIEAGSVGRAHSHQPRGAEHLGLCVDDPESMLPDHAGAIFMGRHTPEALGDYCAGQIMYYRHQGQRALRHLWVFMILLSVHRLFIVRLMAQK